MKLFKNIRFKNTKPSSKIATSTNLNKSMYSVDEVKIPQSEKGESYSQAFQKFVQTLDSLEK